MAYFPFFVDITGKKGIIVGGGRIALHKIGRLLPFSPELTVIAPQIMDEIRAIEGIVRVQREFQECDLSDAFFVIAATDDEALNARVSDLCKSRSIPVNVVDDKEKCSFIFPSIVKKGALTAAVSTEGASPQIAAMLRRQMEAELPEHIEEILDYLAQIRPIAREKISDDRERADFLKSIARRCFAEDGIPEGDVFEQKDRIR